MYAEDMFYNGNLYFNYPIVWIREAEKGNVGQGDLYEGVYTNINDERSRSLRNDAAVVTIGHRNFYRSPSIVENWPCLCFYSVHETTEGKKLEDGAEIFEMAKDYIDAFCNDETFETMLQKELPERMSMVIINNVGTFLERLRNMFEWEGLKEDKDFFIYPVRYRKGRSAFEIEKVLFELLWKEGVFSKQQEYRIILNPNNPKMMELLEDGHKLNIGPMTDIAVMKTNFYDGATFKLKNNRIIVDYSNWNNQVGPLSEWEMMPLVKLMSSLYHTTSVVTDGGVRDAINIMTEIMLVLCAKYNILLQRGEYVDGKDDSVKMTCHGDNMDTILHNEERDSYYYSRFCTWKSPTVKSLIQGTPSGNVNVYYKDRTTINIEEYNFMQLIY